jgi:hypothetical protein
MTFEHFSIKHTPNHDTSRLGKRFTNPRVVTQHKPIAGKGRNSSEAVSDRGVKSMEHNPLLGNQATADTSNRGQNSTISNNNQG